LRKQLHSDWGTDFGVVKTEALTTHPWVVRASCMSTTSKASVLHASLGRPWLEGTQGSPVYSAQLMPARERVRHTRAARIPPWL